MRNFALEKAALLDDGVLPNREILPLFAENGLLGYGLPSNTDGKLPELLAAMQELAALSFSAAFTVWSHRATMEFLAAAGTDYAQKLLADMIAGKRPGSTAMASGFRSLVRLGEPDLTARPSKTGYTISGKISWASNLYPDAAIVTTARTPEGKLLLITFNADTPGCTVSADLDLMGLRGTASTGARIAGLELPQEQVLAEESEALLKKVRPAFSMLQAAICLGLAQSCLEAVPQPLQTPLDVLTEEVEEAAEKFRSLNQQLLDASTVLGTSEQWAPPRVLKLRLDIGLLVSIAAELELKTAGGSAYLASSPTNRRYRAAKFVPVQAPTEAQLRWELEKISG